MPSFSPDEENHDSHPGSRLKRQFQDLLGHMHGLVIEQDILFSKFHLENLQLREQCGMVTLSKGVEQGKKSAKFAEAMQCGDTNGNDVCTGSLKVSLDLDDEDIVPVHNCSSKTTLSAQEERTPQRRVSEYESRPSTATQETSAHESLSQKFRHLPYDNFTMRSEWIGELLSITERKLSCSRTSALFSAMDREQKVAEVTVPKRDGFLSNLILYPASNKRLYWDICSMVLLGWDTLTIPFVLAFDPTQTDTIKVVTWATMIFWTLDICLAFLTGYQDGKTIIINPIKIARNYLKFQFWLDIAIVAVDWVLVLTEQAAGGSAARLGRSLRVLKLLKTLKLLRTLKLKKYIQAVQDQITSEAVSIWFGMMRVVILLLVVNHVVACIWYSVGTINCHCNQPGWVERLTMKSFSVAYRYSTALHWSLAQFTPAPNELFPGNVYERIFATIVLLGAMVTFSGFVSTVTAGVVQLRNMSNEGSRQFWQLRRYLRDWGVDLRFRQRIIRYLEYAYQRQQGRVQEQDVVLLNLLSEQLRVELRQQTLRGHLCYHALFYKLHYHARLFIKALGSKSLATGDLVFGCAEQATEMVFCGAGILEYILGDLPEPSRLGDTPAKLSFLRAVSPDEDKQSEASADSEDMTNKEFVLVGQWVCESVLWTSQWIHLGDLQAHNELCQIITINGQQFGQAVRMNRLLWMDMRKYAERYLRSLNSVQRDSLTDMMHDHCDPKILLEWSDFEASQHAVARSLQRERHSFRWMPNCIFRPRRRSDIERNRSHLSDFGGVSL